MPVVTTIASEPMPSTMNRGRPMPRWISMSTPMASTIRSLSLTESATTQWDFTALAITLQGAQEALHHTIGQQCPAQRQCGLRESHVEVEPGHQGIVADRQPDHRERVEDDESR